MQNFDDDIIYLFEDFVEDRNKTFIFVVGICTYATDFHDLERSRQWVYYRSLVLRPDATLPFILDSDINVEALFNYTFFLN